MTYEAALHKAWDELAEASGDVLLSVRFLADQYAVDIASRTVMSSACNIPAKEFAAILILHYALRKARGMVSVAGEWLTFRELAGIEGYYEAFRKRSIEPVIRKFGSNPASLLTAARRLGALQAEGADASVIVEAFEGVPVLIKVWQSDEDFGPDANMYFDRGTTAVFCTEDIVVLGGMLAAAL